MKKCLFLFLCLVGPIILPSIEGARVPGREFPQYREIHARLAQGWNTWNTRSVTSHMLLPEGFAVNLAFKQHYWLDEQYLEEPLIGRYGKGVENVRPGPHAYDGSFTRLDIEWENLDACIESAHVPNSSELVILLTPHKKPDSPLKLVIETGMLWNRSGSIAKEGNTLVATLPKRT